MAMTPVDFCNELAGRFREIRAVMAEHVSDYGEVLPHVFMGDVTRYVLGDGSSRADVVKALESSFKRHGAGIEELIAVSFVENLETQDDLEKALEGVDAPSLVAEWQRQRSM